jgi:acyl transferase domain-containing protein
VLAGVDLEGNGLFAGRRGGQIASRYTLIRTTAFPYSTSDERAAWQALVATLENALHLHAHRKGTLLRLSGYLHERTGGMIGSLSHLIREAAIINQTEKINQAGLDVVDLDQTAEQHRTMLKRRRRTTGRGSAA